MPEKEIFANIARRQLMGVMFHMDMVEAFTYLDMDGFRNLQEDRLDHEMHAYLNTKRVYAKYYNEIFKTPKPEYPDNFLIPDEWYAENPNDPTKRDNKFYSDAVRELIHRWLEWEKGTRIAYNDLYSTEIVNHNPFLSHYICKLADDVTSEIKEIRKINMALTGYDFNMNSIIQYQRKWA